jgi:hypothetical protein
VAESCQSYWRYRVREQPFTIELYYDDHLEAQGIVSKSLANARIMEKVASEGAHGKDDAFYAEKAVKDNELAKRTVKKNLVLQLPRLPKISNKLEAPFQTAVVWPSW